ncbi:MAG: tetratricopeptide repeat protein [Gammaproteobacteria bacterium]|nr:tetratricopeptide repeat protein [Gammaproteobacteria bacterium]
MDFFNIYSNIGNQIKDSSLDALISLLRLSQYDPYIFNKWIDELLKKAEKNKSLASKNSLLHLLPKIASNFYLMPEQSDTYYYVGLIFTRLNEYEKALDYYQKSLHYFDKKYETYRDMGICYYYLNDFQKALKTFEEALSLRPDSTYIQEWIDYVKKK